METIESVDNLDPISQVQDVDYNQIDVNNDHQLGDWLATKMNGLTEPELPVIKEPEETPEPEPIKQTYSDPNETFVKVKVNGEEKEIPLAEAIAGYQRQQDYTQKTQELSQERQRIEQQKNQVETYLNSIPIFLQAAQDKVIEAEKLLYSEEMQQLAVADPVTYNQYRIGLEKTIYDNKQSLTNMSGQWQQYQEYKNQVIQQQQNQFLQNHQQELAKSNEILTKQYGDEWTSGKLGKQVLEYGKSQGIAVEVLASLTDYKAINALNKARLYDELVSKQSVVQKRVEAIPPKVVKPNSNATDKTDRTEFLKERDKALRSGNKDDIANLISKLL